MIAGEAEIWKEKKNLAPLDVFITVCLFHSLGCFAHLAFFFYKISENMADTF